MICADANVLIGAVSSADVFHDVATTVLAAEDACVLNVTLGEALVRAHRSGTAVEARRILDVLGVAVEPVTDEVADRASRLRAAYGNRNFPMLDALVVAFGIENDCEVVTADDTWPDISEASIRVLEPSRRRVRPAPQRH